MKKPESELADSGWVVFRMILIYLTGNGDFQDIIITPEFVTCLVGFSCVDMAGFPFFVTFNVVVFFFTEVHNAPPFICTALLSGFASVLFNLNKV